MILEAATRHLSRDLTLEDLAAIGFKNGNTFDVEALPSATDTYGGVKGLGPYRR